MRTYTKEERQNAIDRFISGESAADILADTGIKQQRAIFPIVAHSTTAKYEMPK